MLSKRFTNDVANLSTGNYYDEFVHWYDEVVKLINRHGYLLETNECPQIYNGQGNGYIYFRAGEKDWLYSIYYTYYRMPSFRWEIVCYATR